MDRKKIGALVIGAILLGVVLYSVMGNASAEDVEMNIVIGLEEVNSEGDVLSTGIAEFSTSDYDGIGGTGTNENVVFTAVDVGIPYVNPDSNYALNFQVKATANPTAETTTTMSGTVTIVGQVTNGDKAGYDFRTDTAPESEESVVSKTSMSPAIEYLYAFSNAEAFDYIGTGGFQSLRKLTGVELSGATFQLYADYYDENNADITGSTMVDITLVVGTGGEITVNIGTISSTPIE